MKKKNPKKKQSKKDKRFSQKEKRQQSELKHQAKHLAQYKPIEEIEVVLPKTHRELLEKIESMVKKEEFEPAVKLYRSYHKCTLREAKESVEDIRDNLLEERKIFIGENYDEDALEEKFFSHVAKLEENAGKIEAVSKFSNKKITERLGSFGVDFDKEEFLQEVQKFSSSDELLEYWKKKYTILAKREEYDFIWKAIDVLWTRLAPDIIYKERVNAIIREGYQLLKEGEVKKACLLWLKVWEWIVSNPKNSLDIEQVYWGEIGSLFNWCQDLEMELSNAALKDSSFYDKQVMYCQSFCSEFPESSSDILEIMKRGEAEACYSLRKEKEGEKIFKSLIEKNPEFVYNYLAWGDMYAIFPPYEDFPLDYDKAEKIYKMALERASIKEKEIVLIRLKGLEEKKEIFASKSKKNAKKAKKNRKLPKKDDPYEIVHYEITDKPFNIYSNEIQNEIEKIAYKIQESSQSAKEIIPHILKMIEKSPSIPAFYNHLSIAYKHSGNDEKALFWNKEAHRLFPDYLFARINTAYQYLRKNEFDKVMEIFDGKLELKALYPNRDVFHISEVIAFFSLTTEFYLRKGEVDLAERVYEMLEKLDPEHPQVLRLAGMFEHLKSFGNGILYNIKKRYPKK